MRGHLKIFQKTFNKPEKNIYLLKVGEINIQRMNDLGDEWKANNKKAKYTGLTVVEKWKCVNPAHAEIEEDINRGLARKIIDNLMFIEITSDL
jgi:hypothetical protein